MAWPRFASAAGARASGDGAAAGVGSGATSDANRRLASGFSGSARSTRRRSDNAASRSPIASWARALRSNTLTKSRRRVRSTGCPWPKPVCATPLRTAATASSRSKSSISRIASVRSSSRSASRSFSWTSNFSAYSSDCRNALLLGPSPALFSSIATSKWARITLGFRLYNTSWSLLVARRMASIVTLGIFLRMAIQALSCFSATSFTHSYSGGKDGRSFQLPPPCFINQSTSPCFTSSGCLKVGSSRKGGSRRAARTGRFGALRAVGHSLSFSSAAFPSSMQASLRPARSLAKLRFA
mmetsp:Transcript_54545/g.157741  ORF Transcript_54545/g.157741 Transcript_54545/m.157741 type:complete len:298 (-) Transcript_54545:282-1175(-)